MKRIFRKDCSITRAFYSVKHNFFTRFEPIAPQEVAYCFLPWLKFPYSFVCSLEFGHKT